MDWIVTHVSAVDASSVNADAHTRLLAVLVGRALIIRLSGSHQAKTAQRIVDAIVDGASQNDLRGSSNHAGMSGDPNVSDIDIGVLKGVILKPHSRSTLQRVLFNLLATVISQVKTPVTPTKGMPENWFTEVRINLH